MASAFSSSCWQMRMGAVLAAASVGLGAYGAHGMAQKEDEYKKVWNTAVQYNQMGAVALMAIGSSSSGKSAATLSSTSFLAMSPRARFIGGTSLLLGTVLFSGTNYVVAYTQDRQFSKTAPVGGLAMIAGFVAVAVL